MRFTVNCLLARFVSLACLFFKKQDDVHFKLIVRLYMRNSNNFEKDNLHLQVRIVAGPKSEIYR